MYHVSKYMISRNEISLINGLYSLVFRTRVSMHTHDPEKSHPDTYIVGQDRPQSIGYWYFGNLGVHLTIGI